MKRVALGMILLVAVAGVGWLVAQRLAAVPDPNLLYGNVDIRQVDLSFETEGKVISMPEHEGDRVHRGQVIAKLDPATLQSAVALTEARRDSAKAALDVLLAGTRPEQIAQARANYAAAQATLANAQATFARQEDLAARSVSSKQQLDDARMALDSGSARVAQTKAAMEEAVNGPRPEDIAAARANLRAAQATLDLARTQLAHTQLLSPTDGTVMTRVIEPGTVVLPGAAVYSVAIDDESLGAGLRAGTAAVRVWRRHGSDGHNRRRQVVSRQDRLCFADGGVHAENGGNAGVAHAAGVSFPRAGGASGCRPAPGHAGDDPSAGRPIGRRGVKDPRRVQ